MSNRLDNSRKIKAPTGTELSCKSWAAEAPLRMLMNNLDAEVAEKPQELVVYGGIGRAARNWDCYDRIIATLQQLEDDGVQKVAQQLKKEKGSVDVDVLSNVSNVTLALWDQHPGFLKHKRRTDCLHYCWVGDGQRGAFAFFNFAWWQMMLPFI